jgi:hypothetical protein
MDLFVINVRFSFFLLFFFNFKLNLFIAAIIADFSNGQFIRIKFETEWVTEAEHLSFRFKVRNHKFFSLTESKIVFLSFRRLKVKIVYS